MNPRTRPTEWIAAVAGIVSAVLLYRTNHDTAALAAAIGGLLPAVITALAQAVPALHRFRPAEVGTAVAGVVGALILWSNNHDTAALSSAIFAAVPVIVTAFVVAKAGRATTT